MSLWLRLPVFVPAASLGGINIQMIEVADGAARSKAASSDPSWCPLLSAARCMFVGHPAACFERASFPSAVCSLPRQHSGGEGFRGGRVHSLVGSRGRWSVICGTVTVLVSPIVPATMPVCEAATAKRADAREVFTAAGAIGGVKGGNCVVYVALAGVVQQVVVHVVELGQRNAPGEPTAGSGRPALDARNTRPPRFEHVDERQHLHLDNCQCLGNAFQVASMQPIHGGSQVLHSWIPV
mmetsp:Transcript_18496/g.44544  ORF Transcript_18496/g.44544 Transcript_18496/m.44544 type:complete len:239 (-) Transcript_18496:878-1594(-)